MNGLRLAAACAAAPFWSLWWLVRELARLAREARERAAAAPERRFGAPRRREEG